MATFNATAADVLRNATIAADHFERTAAATTTFIVPTTTPTLQLEPFTGVAGNTHFVATAGSSGAATSHHHTHQTNSTTSSYTFVQIKREPCQVSEVTTSNNCHHHQQLTTTQQQQQHSSGMSSSSKTTLTTLVKIEASSPKVQELDKGTLAAAPMANTNNSVPVGIAVARKRPQESGPTITNSSLPVQQPLNKDMNCYGIRVADIGGVSSGCNNFYFAGNGDLMTGSAHSDDLALSAAGVQGINRAPSTFWQYPTVPIESVISMSPATVGLQYPRDASRGQVVLLPATAAALGISNFPLYTPTDPFQQAAAAAFVWPSYIPQGTATTALQPPHNFIFPSMSPHSSLQASSYATPLQLLGSNYLTAAAAAAAAAAASSSYCQHNQQQTNSSSSSTSTINLGLGTTNNSSAVGSASSRFLSLAATESKRLQETTLPKQQQQQQLLPLTFPPPTMKIEEWNATEFMATAAAKTLSTTTTLSATTHQNHHIGPPTTALNFERDKSMPGNFLEFQETNSQALNLMRLPTPPTSASIEATTAQLQPQILFQANATGSPALLNLSASSAAILPRAGNGASTSLTTNFINNVSTTTFAGTLNAPTTGLSDEALNFKAGTQETQQQFVVGVPRLVGSSAAGSAVGPPPQMQDVNIQTDTPVCSEDENSSCPLAIQSNNIPTSGSPASATPPPSDIDAHENEPPQQPLELTVSGVLAAERSNVEKEPEDFHEESRCHNNDKGDDTAQSLRTNSDNLDSTLLENQVQDIRFQAIAQNGQQVEVSSAVGPSAESATDVSRSLPPQSAPEDLTGLELLSNISTSSFATKPTLSVKQEPVDQIDYQVDYSIVPEPLIQVERYGEHKVVDDNFRNNAIGNTTLCLANNLGSGVSLLPQPQLTEPLGGLNLLCALAEQRIQEEVQISGSIFNVNTTVHDEQQVIFHQQQLSRSFGIGCNESSEKIEEKITPSSFNETKRKKHKHSQSSKSSKKSASRYAKKNKKKCAREKRKNKQLVSQEREMELDDDEELKEDLKSAFDKVDSSYKRFGKWPNREEIFNAMESDMRKRLAEITRQYRKKKRKLDEISKNKKHKKKALKMSALNAGLVLNVAAGTATTTTSLSCLGSLNVATNTSNNTHPLSASPLCDYKFSKLLTKPSNTTTGSYLSPSNFMRFSDSKPQTQAQFPPAVDVDLNDMANTPSCSMSSLYKPLRLEPSSLAAIDGGRNTPMRSHKHTSSEKCSQLMATPCKERKLMKGRQSIDSSEVASNAKKKSLQNSSIDRELTLTSEHLYRKETRVLTDMGGLFYAGIMKPLQPPDVYAITLDGERGNKSHIMSREEIFKDTIIEVSPSSIESVPVGTRLCAYWSQQYRCLYPGKAIESEASDDGSKNDFVSVEFDDGDSGRIRLQNIRFLLSDYPIVEYDNQLYSLGKQKRSVMKSGNNSEHTQHPELSSTEDQHHQIANDSTELQQNSMELFTYRSEKKRMKSMKKKSLMNADGGVIVDGNGRMRKHHKHKKRKKHKKHHHRKTLAAVAATAAGVSNGVSYATDMPSIYGNRKQEQPEDEELLDASTFANDDESGNEYNREVNTESRSERIKPTVAMNSNFKTESTATQAEEANAVGVKVKTENLDLEEETTSNMMSEISDEAKIEDDGIEHNNSKGSKIAAFLPERQLWGWLGKAYRKAGVKGRARKQFYKTIKRGKETITVGDCAVFLSTGRPDRPYIGRIESMWETASSNKVVRVRWFYHPEETTGCPNLKYPGGLFESPHEDENDVQTISHRCAVLPFSRYFEKFGADSKQYQSIYDNNDTYYLSGYYNPRLQVLKLQDDIPVVEEKSTTSS